MTLHDRGVSAKSACNAQPIGLASERERRPSPSLDDINLRILLGLDRNPDALALNDFLEFIRQRYELAIVLYYCPSFHGPSPKEPFLLLAPSDVLTPHHTAASQVAANPALALGARSLLPFPNALLRHPNENEPRPSGDPATTDAPPLGLTIPVRGPRNSLWALFSVTSTETAESWASRRGGLLKDLIHVANYLHQRAYEMHGEEEPAALNTLTKRETEALEWSAEGKTIEDISILMRISAETVKAHLDSSRYKLKALTRAHAVAKAIRAGLIH